MVLGYNHNLMYKGEVFHVQTEDSGVDNPHIITLLYRGGVIISSKKTSYSDILKMEHLEAVVEELMKEQHKEMMRRLKGGEFDEKAFSFKAQLMENYKIQTLEPELDPIAEFLVPPTSSPLAENETVSHLVEQASQTMNNDLPVQGQKSETSDPKSLAVNLDEAILSFFGSREK